ncbi:MAG: GyrI-like domain-containing protein [Candidatus Bathyarchaeota archaeon]|nr:MAG: GyrI-like domain-containing protein [Candidatus Bathyarchaeota archaeon]
MSDFVKIVSLPPMKVVSFHSMGEFLGDPEEKASTKMMAWAKSKGLLSNPREHQVFGFNNPDPPISEEGIPEPNKRYGYEYWITVEDDFKTEENIDVKTVDGGSYAVLTCRVESPVDIGKTWGKLIKWIQESEKYDFHPNCRGLKSRHSKSHFEYGITGLEHHLNLLESPPKGKPWKTPEKLVMDIYVPVIEK